MAAALFDNLRVGAWVAVVDCYEDHPTPWGFSKVPTFDGDPWEVVALDWPFLLLRQGGTTRPLDYRAWGVKVLSKSYVRAWCGGRNKPLPHAPAGRRRRKDKPDPRDCPRCGERTRLRMSKNTDYTFHRVCPKCGFDGGPEGKGAEK